MIKNLLKKIVIYIITLEARLILKRFKPQIIAITGSVGKTTTKEAVVAALKSTHDVRGNEKTLNSDIGVPLTIIGRQSGWNSFFEWLKVILIGLRVLFFSRKYPRLLVLEAGIDAPGDMQNLTQWLRPDVAVVTELADVPVHVEFFGSPEALYREKGFLVERIEEGGAAVLNIDSAHVVDLAQRTKEKIFYVSPYGFKKADISFESVEYLLENDRPIGLQVNVKVKGVSLHIPLYGVLGKHIASSVIFALGVAHVMGVESDKVIDGLSHINFMPGRMKILEGINGTTLIDDTYNSSPIAAMAGLQTLQDLHLSKMRKAAILGKMAELGDLSEDSHRKVGAQAIKVLDCLIVVGEVAKPMYEEAVKNKKDGQEIFYFGSNDDLLKQIDIVVKENDLILIKGSQSARLEKVVKVLLEDKVNAEKLLVRQGREWEIR